MCKSKRKRFRYIRKLNTLTMYLGREIKVRDTDEKRVEKHEREVTMVKKWDKRNKAKKRKFISAFTFAIQT